jgi:fibronectin-binding autotransporter adhesin
MRRRVTRGLRGRRQIVSAALLAASSILPLSFNRAASAAPSYWDSDGANPGAGGATPAGTWGVDAFWSTSSTGSAATAAWTPSDTAIFSAGTNATGAFTVTVSGTQVSGGVNFEEGTVTLAGGTLNLATPVVDVAAASSATIISQITTSTSGLVKSGAGTLTLLGPNTYTNGSTITGGTLRIGATNAAGLGALNIASGTFALNGSFQTVTNLTFGNGVATGAGTVSGAGTLTLNGDITFSGKPSFQTAPATIASNVSLASGTRTITNVGTEVSSDNYDVVISGVLSGAGGLTKAGSDNFTTVLTTPATYTGATNVNGGLLFLAVNNALPVATALTVASGTAIGTAPYAQTGVTPGNYNITVGSLAGAGNVLIGSGTLTVGSLNTSTTLSGGISDDTLGGNLVKVGAGTLTLSGGNAYAGGTTISAGTLQIGAGSTTGTIIGNVANSGAITFNRSDSLTYAGVISGTGAFTKTGGGALALTATQTYTGGATVSGGALRAVDGVGLPANVLLTLNGGAWEPMTATVTRVLGVANGNVRLTGGASGFSAFGTPLIVDIGGDGTGSGGQLTWGSTNFNQSSLVLNATTANAALEFKNAINLGATVVSRTVTVNTNTATISGQISGVSGSLVKNGAGTLLLRNTGNSYAGSTSVSAGILNIDTDAQLGPAPGVATPSKITLSGGTLQFASSTTLNANRGLSVTASSVINTQGGGTFNVTYAGAITGASALTKSGLGSLTLGTSNSAYTGALSVTGGTLIAGASSSLGSAAASNTLTLNAGALQSTGPIVANTRNVAIGTSGGAIDLGGFDSTFGNIDGSGTGGLTKTSAGVLTVSHVRLGGNLVIGGGRVAIAPNGQAAGTNSVTSLSVAGAQLDLSDNHLVEKTTGVGTWTGSNYTGMTGLIASGRNGGAWNGNGIITSQSNAAASNFTTIGVASAAQVEGIGSTLTSVWSGLTVTGTDTLAMYTYGGDANLDGKINVDDYTRIDFSVPLGSSGWYNGDFNYDGKINVDDYTIIDFNVGIQGSPFFTAAGGGRLSAVAVPEPVSLGLAAALSPFLLRQRRSRKPT